MHVKFLQINIIIAGNKGASQAGTRGRQTPADGREKEALQQLSKHKQFQGANGRRDGSLQDEEEKKR